MMKIGKWYVVEHGDVVCPNYGGWVVAEEWNWYIYKTLKDAREAVKKFHTGDNKTEPRIIGKMTEEQYINALCDNN